MLIHLKWLYDFGARLLHSHGLEATDGDRGDFELKICRMHQNLAVRLWWKSKECGLSCR